MIWKTRSGDLVGVSMGCTFIIRTRDGIVTLLAQTWVEMGFDSVDEAKAKAEEMA